MLQATAGDKRTDWNAVKSNLTRSKKKKYTQCLQWGFNKQVNKAFSGCEGKQPIDTSDNGVSVSKERLKQFPQLSPF